MRFLGRLIVLVVLACCLPIPAWAQAVASAHAPGFPHDWSHRHLIFSKPPKSLNKPPPRYSMQQAWRERQLTVTGAAAFDARALQLVHSWGRPAKTNKTKQALARDWAMSMGTSGTVGEGMYPAKFSFNTGSANCGSAATPDFVVYNTGPAGAATGMVSFLGTGAANNDTVTIGGITYTFETACSGSTPANCIIITSTPTADISTSGLQAALANNLNLCQGAINPCFTNVSGPNSSVTVTASRPSTGPEAVTLTAISTGAAGDSTLSTTASASRITVSGLTGGTDEFATIVAYDNLYTGCSSGTVPQLYWQYNTGYAQNSTTWDHSVAGTSVVLSLDGSQVAFVENAGGAASLVILKWAQMPIWCR
jgi:hypothetical protein